MTALPVDVKTTWSSASNCRSSETFSSRSAVSTARVASSNSNSRVSSSWPTGYCALTKHRSLGLAPAPSVAYQAKPAGCSGVSKRKRKRRERAGARCSTLVMRRSSGSSTTHGSLGKISASVEQQPRPSSSSSSSSSNHGQAAAATRRQSESSTG